MLTLNGKRIENADGELVAVVTNTERKAERVRRRHRLPAFVGPVDLEELEERLAAGDDGTPAAAPPAAAGESTTPDEPVDLLEGKSRSELDEIASQLGISLSEIVGTGKNGNVVAGDVKTAIEIVWLNMAAPVSEDDGQRQTDNADDGEETSDAGNIAEPAVSDSPDQPVVND